MGRKKTKKNKTKQKVNSMKGGKDIRREREKSPKKQNITKKEGKGKLVPIKKKKQRELFTQLFTEKSENKET